mmetsp:Transcript_17738/g.24921  ORF Transcript_17738/g.24921 Transcript_17738/m.24921 type:complete len:257 (-) Transcript_17738:181-951(-)
MDICSDMFKVEVLSDETDIFLRNLLLKLFDLVVEVGVLPFKLLHFVFLFNERLAVQVAVATNRLQQILLLPQFGLIDKDLRLKLANFELSFCHFLQRPGLLHLPFVEVSFVHSLITLQGFDDLGEVPYTHKVALVLVFDVFQGAALDFQAVLLVSDLLDSGHVVLGQHFSFTNTRVHLLAVVVELRLHGSDLILHFFHLLLPFLFHLICFPGLRFHHFDLVSDDIKCFLFIVCVDFSLFGMLYPLIQFLLRLSETF